MTCPDCEYHKGRAALWRHEAYKLGGTPLPWDVDEVIKKAVEAEREACCRIVTGLCISDNNAREINDAIKARRKE
jgi:hypothetical protein